MIYNIYVLDRIIHTSSPDYHRYIWTDGYEQEQASDWPGYFRGVISGFDENGEFERWDNKDGVIRWASGIPVVDTFIDQGGSLEPYTPIEPEPEE